MTTHETLEPEFLVELPVACSHRPTASIGPVGTRSGVSSVFAGAAMGGMLLRSGGPTKPATEGGGIRCRVLNGALGSAFSKLLATRSTLSPGPRCLGEVTMKGGT